jgi:hypothetical protein
MNTSRIDALAMAAAARADFPHDDTVATSNEPTAAKTNTPGMASGEKINLGDGKAQHEVTVVKKKSSRRIRTSFPGMLHAILADKNLKSIITWLPSGKSFVIMDKAKFIDMVLSRYFRVTQFHSFSRRLKRWGFNKVYTTGMAQAVYCHRLFQKDRPDLSKLMNGSAGRGQQVRSQQARVTEAAVTEETRLADRVARSERIPVLTNRSFHEEVGLPPQGTNEVNFTPLATAGISGQIETAMTNYTPVAMPGNSMPTNQMAMTNIFPRSSFANNVNLFPAVGHTSIQHGSIVDVTVMRQLAAIDEEITDCQEQLVVLQRLRELRQRRFVINIWASFHRRHW